MSTSINVQYRKYLRDYCAYVNGMNEVKKSFNFSHDNDTEKLSLIKLTKYPSNSYLKRNFLIIPSIFNSSDILCLARGQNFVEILRKYGNVYMINWQQTENLESINDYVLEVIKLLVSLGPESGLVDLVGHCFGGNIAVGVGSLRPDLISSMTLLTTPWDYSHFSSAVMWHKLLDLDKPIRNLKVVPKIYLQMMFFLLFPNQFLKKVNRYYEMEPAPERQIYMQVEHWLQSGADIPASIYSQFIDQIITQNIFYNNNWKIDEAIINPANIDVPVCIISAMDDQIAPIGSTLALHGLLKNSTLVKIKGGHISYLINSDQDFVNQYSSWFKQA